MNISKIIAVALTAIAVQSCSISAGSLSGIVAPVYTTTAQVFHNGDVIKGFVRINNGFTIAPAATALFDTFITVSGGIDLKGSGIISLNNDLRLESSVTLSTGGGIIAGRGHAIVLQGDLTLTSTTYVNVLHIRSGTVIDGQGKTLFIGDNAQIFVDTNATLTLRNLVLQTGMFSRTPPIRLASMYSKLALDNVVIRLGSDFIFPQGQLFIHNDVEITGTSSFIYQSPRPSYITSGGILMIDKGTTFSVAPASFTDAYFSSIPTTISNKFLVMQDASSALFLNGCSFNTTSTGLRLTKGNLFFDNHVVVSTAATVDISTITPATQVGSDATGSASRFVTWSPDGRFLAVVNSDALQIYRFNGTSTPSTVGGTATTGANSSCVGWSPDGQFIAVVSQNDTTLQIFAFNGSSTPTQVGSTITTLDKPVFVVWSPDGRFIAVVNSDNTSIYGYTLQIYRFDGSNTPVMVASTVVGITPTSVAWSPDGRFLVAVSLDDSSLKVYQFDGVSTLTQIGSTITTSQSGPALWSPDGRFIAVLDNSGDTLQIYSFNGTSTPSTVGGTVATGTGPGGLSWSPNGQFIAVMNFGDSTLQIYSFDGSSTPTTVGGTVATGTDPEELSWSPNGQFIAVVNSTANTLQVFKVNYVSPINPQGFTNTLNFGDRGVGSSANLNVQLLSRARVEVSGKVNDDSV